MHPILLELGPLTLRSYGLMMALGFAFGAFLASRLYAREGGRPERVYDLSVWIMFGAILGARALYVAVLPEQFAQAPWWEVFAVQKGGLVYYGGLIGGGLAAYFWMRRQKLAVWRLADCLAPGLALGQAFGRVGCFLNGCCYGRVDAEHGVVFPGLDEQPRLPVQLYESAFALGLAALLAWFKPRRAYPGQAFALYLLLYGLGRFGLESLRGDAERGTLISASLSPGQWLSLGCIAFAAAFHLLHRKKPA
jgi:phosphatidylglycerol:prolipoprotein diacylglycerol transferase